MKIRPAHHAILCYAEWCCDTRRQWPGIERVAADVARDVSDIQQAFGELLDWGLVNMRYCGGGMKRILRLGDGRETATFAHDILVIHSQTSESRRGIIRAQNARIAA